MKKLTLAALALLSARYVYRYPALIPHPEVALNFNQLCAGHGFECDRYEVETEDGYILEQFRVRPKKQNGEVVFLQHGVLSSADAWVCNGRKLSAAFILADKGYEVWLGNSRGSFYSRRHVSLNPDKDSQFWEYSFVEMGRHDLPAAINLALEKSKASKLHYVGTSQGSSQMLVALSQAPRFWQQRLKTCTLMAPVARLQTTSLPRRLFANLRIADIVARFSRGEVLSRRPFIALINSFLCAFLPEICMFATDYKRNNLTQLPVFASHVPSGASVRCYQHFAQLIRNKKFEYYDHGQSRNKEIYNAPAPPQINLNHISPLIPILMIVGSADSVASQQDSLFLKNKLMETGNKRQYLVRDLSHDSFTFGQNMDHFEKDLVKFMETHQEER